MRRLETTLQLFWRYQIWRVEPHTRRVPRLGSENGHPSAPPSMIITPSHAPRRVASVEPDDTALTSVDILRLHEKLNAIEKETEKDITLATATRASTADDRRGRTMTTSALVASDTNRAAGATHSDAPDGTGMPTIYYLFINVHSRSL